MRWLAIFQYSRVGMHSVASQQDDGAEQAQGMGDGHTIMNLVKSALGAGSLSLPKAFLLVSGQEKPYLYQHVKREPKRFVPKTSTFVKGCCDQGGLWVSLPLTLLFGAISAYTAVSNVFFRCGS
jgi:hypothetical protein